jgi:hypothetical protein
LETSGFDLYQLASLEVDDGQPLLRFPDEDDNAPGDASSSMLLLPLLPPFMILMIVIIIQTHNHDFGRISDDDGDDGSKSND